MGQLADLLSQPTAVEVEVGTKFDADGSFTQAVVLDVQPRSIHELLILFGHDPEAVTVDGSVGVSHRELVDGRTVSTYRYKLREVKPPLAIEELVEAAKKAPKHVAQRTSEEPFWFVFQAGDLQIGKRSRDGSTEEIISGYIESLMRAANEFGRLKGRGIGGIQISMPGDCVEGVVSQGGKNVWLTQETITEQTRVLRRLMLQTIEIFAPLADQVFLDVVGGNHDEAQRQWNTYPGDNWATECAIAVDDALKMNPAAFGHVTTRIPEKWSGHMTVPVGDTLVTVVHGHQFGREANALKWWQEQAFGKHGPHGSRVLQNGHFHEVALERSGDRTRMQSPTFDMGSDWYREAHGCGNTRGALVYLLRTGEVSQLSVV